MTFGPTLTFVLVLGAVSVAAGQESALPADPISGRLVFEAKGCLNCHSLGGYGGSEGPDLAREQFFGSAADLASVMWNHVPEMSRSFRRSGIRWVELTESEMKDLMGFLYYLRYLGEPGSALRGKELLEEKGCSRCHGADGPAPDLRVAAGDLSPVSLVQEMWNHGPSMRDEVAKLGMKYPLLGPDDIGDISAFLQLSSGGSAQIGMSPGNPNQGRSVFETKGCTNCHSIDGKTKKEGPDLYLRDLEMSVTQIAGLMWNHAPLMSEQMDKADIEWPEFTGHEMADLIAFLYFLGFQDEPGDAAAGRAVFEQKNCVDCHESEGPNTGPDLTTIGRPNSVMGLLAQMWSHGPDMEELLLTRNMAWPEMTGKDVNNLFQYLHSHMRTRQ